MERAMLAVFEVTLSLRTMTEANESLLLHGRSRPSFETFDVSAGELTRVCHVGQHIAERNVISPRTSAHLLRA